MQRERLLPIIDMFHVWTGVPLNLEFANLLWSFPPLMTPQIRYYPEEGPKFFQVPRPMYRGAYLFFKEYFSSK